MTTTRPQVSRGGGIGGVWSTCRSAGRHGHPGREGTQGTQKQRGQAANGSAPLSSAGGIKALTSCSAAAIQSSCALVESAWVALDVSAIGGSLPRPLPTAMHALLHLSRRGTTAPFRGSPKCVCVLYGGPARTTEKVHSHLPAWHVLCCLRCWCGVSARYAGRRERGGGVPAADSGQGEQAAPDHQVELTAMIQVVYKFS